MRIFVTGGSGFVGHHLIQTLIDQGHTVRCLIRHVSAVPAASEYIETTIGDVTQPEGLEQAMSGCDAVIHLVGIIRAFPQRGITFNKLHIEATRNIVAATEKSGIRRYLHMSANGASPQAHEKYALTKWHAEELVRQSQLDWTIFRPSLIYGQDGEFTQLLYRQVRYFPIVPIIGDGHYQLTPVAVRDVALGFAKALSCQQASKQIFHCCGPDTCSYNELIDLVAEAMGKRAPAKLHHPLSIMYPLTRLFEGLSFFPVTCDQISMLTQGNVCDCEHWASTLQITPTPLAEGIKKALAG